MASGPSGLASILSRSGVSSAQVEDLLKVGSGVAQVGQAIGRAIAAPVAESIAPLTSAAFVRQTTPVPKAIQSSLDADHGVGAGAAQVGGAVGISMMDIGTELHDKLKAFGDALFAGQQKLEEFAREAFDSILKRVCGGILGNESGQGTAGDQGGLTAQLPDLQDTAQPNQSDVSCGAQALIKWLMEHVANPLSKIEQHLHALTEKKAPDVARRLESIDNKMAERPEQNQLAFTEFVKQMAEHDTPRPF